MKDKSLEDAVEHCSRNDYYLNRHGRTLLDLAKRYLACMGMPEKEKIESFAHVEDVLERVRLNEKYGADPRTWWARGKNTGIELATLAHLRIVGEVQEENLLLQQIVIDLKAKVAEVEEDRKRLLDKFCKAHDEKGNLQQENEQLRKELENTNEENIVNRMTASYEAGEICEIKKERDELKAQLGLNHKDWVAQKEISGAYLDRVNELEAQLKVTSDSFLSYQRLCDELKAKFASIINSSPIQMTTPLGLLPVNSTGMRTLVDAFVDATGMVRKPTVEELVGTLDILHSKETMDGKVKITIWQEMKFKIAQAILDMMERKV